VRLGSTISTKPVKPVVQLPHALSAAAAVLFCMVVSMCMRQCCYAVILPDQAHEQSSSSCWVWIHVKKCSVAVQPGCAADHQLREQQQLLVLEASQVMWCCCAAWHVLLVTSYVAAAGVG
jgi:hypothetical protein